MITLDTIVIWLSAFIERPLPVGTTYGFLLMFGVVCFVFGLMTSAPARGGMRKAYSRVRTGVKGLVKRA